jgi:N-acetylmuramoyl-L-alanine amidase
MPSNFSKFVVAALLCMSSLAVAAEAPELLTRDEWQAKPPSMKMTAQKPAAILIHHTGTAQKPKATLVAKMKGLQRFSQAREKLADGRTKPAWPDVPYHFYIAVDGKIAEGRDVNAVGDTNTGYDPGGFIQVVVEGNFDKEELTGAQTESLKSLLQWLLEKHGLKPESILSHKDKAQTACPGKDLSAKLPDIVSALK